MDDQERVNALWAAQRDAADVRDEELIGAFVADVRPLRDEGKHVSLVYEVILETGLLSFFKPANGYREASTALKRALVNYGQTPVSAMISECAAWQLARRLGGVWQAIAMPAVVRTVRLPNGRQEIGSLARFRPRRTGSRAYFREAPELALAGAFFDCLIGQQDRNPANVHWQEERRRIFLIDNAFSFMRASDRRGLQELQQWRWERGDRALNAEEAAAVERVIAEDLFGAVAYLDAERSDALLGRAHRMHTLSRLLPWTGDPLREDG